MRRRFGGRRRRGAGEGREAPIDAERWLSRIVEEGLVAVPSLDPMESEGVDSAYAALGKGEGQSGVITTMEKGGFVVVKTDGGDFIAKSLVDVTAK